MSQKRKKCQKCLKETVSWSKYCGANVCDSCGHHQGLARCFCGWNMQSGQILEDDIGNSRYLGDGEWEVDY